MKFFKRSNFFLSSLTGLFFLLPLVLLLGCIHSSFADSYFQDVIGIPEKSFKSKSDQNDKKFFKDLISIHEIDGKDALTLHTTNGDFKCGYFEEISIGDLEKLCEKKKKVGGGKFNVVQGVGTTSNSSFLKYVDVAQIQANLDNKDAVFQVASNFNTLEAVGAYQDVYKQQLLEHYVYDLTQGPAASISAAPGTILRRYFLYYDKDLEPKDWGQTKERHVNFLSELKNINVSDAGYPVFSKTTLKPSKNDYKKIKVGFHDGVQVTHKVPVKNGKFSPVFIPNSSKQLINQVFTAAVNLGGTNKNVKHLKNVQEWAQVILNSAYEGTLRAVFVKDKKKVFLTLIGGGVFDNSFESIFKAINRMKDFIKESGLDVTLIWYKSNPQETVEEKDLKNNLLGLVKSTGGEYLRYKGNDIYKLSLKA